jgi:hypothetical protein
MKQQNNLPVTGPLCRTLLLALALGLTACSGGSAPPLAANPDPVITDPVDEGNEEEEVVTFPPLEDGYGMYVGTIDMEGEEPQPALMILLNGEMFLTYRDKRNVFVGSAVITATGELQVDYTEVYTEGIKSPPGTEAGFVRNRGRLTANWDPRGSITGELYSPPDEQGLFEGRYQLVMDFAPESLVDPDFNEIYGQWSEVPTYPVLAVRIDKVEDDQASPPFFFGSLQGNTALCQNAQGRIMDDFPGFALFRTSNFMGNCEYGISSNTRGYAFFVPTDGNGPLGDPLIDLHIYNVNDVGSVDLYKLRRVTKE